MASASTWKPSAAPPSANEVPGVPRRVRALGAFLVALVGLSLACQFLLLRAGAPASVAAPQAGLLFPLPWLLELLRAGVATAGVPVALLGPFLAVLAGACFLSLLWRDLAGVCGGARASACVLLVAVNPAFLQMLLDGDMQVYAVLGFYGLCRTLRHLRGDIEAFTYLRIGGWLCLMLCITPLTAVLAVVLAPWLSLVVPWSMRRRARVPFYLVCYLPFVLVVGGWAYLVWSAGLGAWPTLDTLAPPDHGAGAFAGLAFARDWPGVLRWAVAVPLCFPVLVMAWLWRGIGVLRVATVALGTVASATLLVALLHIPAGGCVALVWAPVALLLRGLRPAHAWTTLALLLAGALGAVVAYPHAVLLPVPALVAAIT